MWPRWKSSKTRRRLPALLAACLLLPWLLGEWAKTFHQPGLGDDTARAQLLIDFIVAGGVLFALTMLLTWVIGCWISAVMHGPRRDGDPFPAGQGSPQHDD
jgi:hypothetical protein